MPLTRRKQILLLLMTPFIIGLISLILADIKVQKSISEKRFLRPTEYYSSPARFFTDQVVSPKRFLAYFAGQSYRQRGFGEPLRPGDFSLGGQEQCQELLPQLEGVFQCVLFRARLDQELNVVMINEWDKVIGTYRGENFDRHPFVQGEAPLFAQYLGDKPTRQRATPIDDIPRYCLDAVLAIEDPDFLEHKGFSPKSFARAVLANLRSGRYSQGGSTITQQLIKNYFLTPEKTIIRKLKEILMAIIFDLRVSKDEILETYLNIIYLGQDGVFEVRGYGSAADFYFQKNISQLELHECALLAAIVNSPGRYNPIRQPERAQQRRTRVLQKMLDEEFIVPEEFAEAVNKGLPTQVKKGVAASAPYYVDAVNKQLIELGFTDRSGLKVFTALQPDAQKWAQDSVIKSINFFETQRAQVKQIKEEQKKNLQASLVASDPRTGEVVAIVGGRQFATSPFNRAIESRRQVGSVFKPLVYLTAVKQNDQERPTPLRPLDNSPYRLEYEGQVWEPKNYSGQFSAPVPLFYALKESMNVPTARLAMAIGLDNIIETARDLGITSPLKAFPSLALGAFELAPLEVLSAYNAISQLGVKNQLQIVKQVTGPNGATLYKHPQQQESLAGEDNFAVLVGMLRETLISGTGAFSRQMGFQHIAAGKTGTTSDTRDAWFAGFTPFHSAVVWVGYDDGTPHGMTGAAAALPIWTNYMRRTATQFANVDFSWPHSVEEKQLGPSELAELGVPEEKQKDTFLIFKKNPNP